MERQFRPQPPRNNGCRRKENRASRDRRERKRKYDAEATRKIIAEYGHIVRFIAHKLAYNLPASMEMGDLINVGLVGLMDAAERFEASRGFKFTTFAEFRIRGAMLDELRRQDWIPRGARERARDFQSTREKLAKELGHAPTTHEIAEKMGLPDVKVEELEQNDGVAKIVRFENLAQVEEETTDGGSEVELDYTPYEVTSRKNIRQVMEKVIHELPERLQHILVMYYFEELSLKEIGAKLAITESRVSQLHTRALVGMRKILDEKAEYAELKRLLA